MTTESIHEEVRARYAAAAVQASAGSCCSGEEIVFGSELYSALERAELPGPAVLASLGCGNPIAVAELHEGERVLDLAPAAASTSCSPRSGSALPGAPSAST